MKLTELSKYYIKELNPGLRLENIKGGICYKGTWKSGTSKEGKQWFNGQFVRTEKGTPKAMKVLPHISEWDISKTDINKLFAILAEEK